MTGTIKIIAKIWKKSLNLIGKHPSVCMPFFCLAICEALWLSLWYYAPRPPVSLVLAPIIKTFLGEQFLHYPANFLILPRLAFIGRILIYLSFGLLSLAMTIAAVFQIETEQVPARLWGNLNRALRRYFSLLFIGIIFGICAFLTYRILRFIIGRLFANSLLLVPASYAMNILFFIISIMLEALFIYATGFILLYREKIFTCIKKSFLLFKRFFIAAVFFIFTFRILNFAIILVKKNILNIADKFFPLFPEIVLVVLGIEIACFFIAHVFIVILMTQLLLENTQR